MQEKVIFDRPADYSHQKETDTLCTVPMLALSMRELLLDARVDYLVTLLVVIHLVFRSTPLVQASVNSHKQSPGGG